MKENLDAAKSIIDSISANIWGLITNLIALILGWMTAIYLISPAFYIHTPLYMFVITSISIAVQWQSVWFVCYATVALVKESKPDINAPYIYLSTATGSIGVMGLAILIGYLTHARFRDMVVCAYAVPVFTIVFGFTIHIFSTLPAAYNSFIKPVIRLISRIMKKR